MPHRLQRPLARPVILNKGDRRFETFLDAVACLHNRAGPATGDGVDGLIDLLIRAAESGDPSLIEIATESFADMIERWRTEF